MIFATPVQFDFNTQSTKSLASVATVWFRGLALGALGARSIYDRMDANWTISNSMDAFTSNMVGINCLKKSSSENQAFAAWQVATLRDLLL